MTDLEKVGLGLMIATVAIAYLMAELAKVIGR